MAITFVVDVNSTATWEFHNPILSVGQVVYNSDVNKIKVGIGEKWNDTPYLEPEILDNLTSDNSTKALSAKQGKALKTLVDSKLDFSNLPELMEIVDNLETSNGTNKALSARQGKVLKDLVDNIRTVITQYINEHDLGGIDDAPKNGKTYIRKNGAWIEIENGTTPIPDPTKVVTEDSLTQTITVTIPFKYAMNQTNTLINDIFNEDHKFSLQSGGTSGVITKVAFQANVPDATKVNVLVNNMNVLNTAQTVTTDIKEHSCGYNIVKDQKIEIQTSQSYNAEDLKVIIYINKV